MDTTPPLRPREHVADRGRGVLGNGGLALLDGVLLQLPMALHLARHETLAQPGEKIGRGGCERMLVHIYGRSARSLSGE